MSTGSRWARQVVRAEQAASERFPKDPAKQRRYKEWLLGITSKETHQEDLGKHLGNLERINRAFSEEITKHEERQERGRSLLSRISFGLLG
jgi:hypothetical protein